MLLGRFERKEVLQASKQAKKGVIKEENETRLTVKHDYDLSATYSAGDAGVSACFSLFRPSTLPPSSSLLLSLPGS